MCQQRERALFEQQVATAADEQRAGRVRAVFVLASEAMRTVECLCVKRNGNSGRASEHFFALLLYSLVAHLLLSFFLSLSFCVCATIMAIEF